MEAAEGLYDVVRRAFEGVRPRRLDETIGLRVRHPTRMPPLKRIKSKPTKYVRDESGVKVPLRSI